MAQGKTPPEGSDMELVAQSWEYACSHIPTRHLNKCFQYAMNAKRDTFPLTAFEVNLQWEGLKEVLLIQAEPSDIPQLPAGPSSYMTLSDFKDRHNLPAEWSLGDPYPPESGLYNKPVPLTYDERQLYRCLKCKDAGWTRIPYNRITGKVELIRCDCR